MWPQSGGDDNRLLATGADSDADLGGVDRGKASRDLAYGRVAARALDLQGEVQRLIGRMRLAAQQFDKGFYAVRRKITAVIVA